MARVDLLYFDAGGGHRAAATALSHVLSEPLTPRMVHLQDILAPVDVFKKVLRIDLQEIYNTMLRRGWTLGSPQGLRFMQAVIAAYRKPCSNLMAKWWEQDPPSMVVSVIPNFNRPVYEGYQRVAPGRPYVTILTDLADYPPHFWIERQPGYTICGSAKAVEQALALGHPKEAVFPVSGMILNPKFYDLPPVDQRAEREKLGLDPDAPTALVLFGGYGTGVMETILDELESAQAGTQLILVAGRNEKLRQKLEAKKTKLRKHVVGFTKDVPYFMQLADFFIGKPGPGSLSEAIHMGLPAITVRNAWTLPQERYNAEWLRETGTGLVLSSFRSVADAVRRLLSGSTLEEMRRNARAQQNRAIFEIPPILQEIASRHGS